ncbi:MAG: type VI secretion system tube protein Hcp [Candidatus Omnitrophica bacterium]|nr:type VI secretion system tube protein Hcp [Candidatus Omnitrophota bacterium]
MNCISRIGWLFKCFLLLAVGIVTIAPVPCNLKIDEYPGSSTKEGREGTSDVFAVDHELVQPYDPATGEASGVRQHRPLTVLKEIDKASPGLHKALATGQILKEAVLDFYRIDPASRQEAKYYTITMKEVRIVGIKTMMPTSFLPENESYRHMEEVRMVYRTIEWNWRPDNIVEMDTWPAVRAASEGAMSSTNNGAAQAVGRRSVKPANATSTDR